MPQELGLNKCLSPESVEPQNQRFVNPSYICVSLSPREALHIHWVPGRTQVSTNSGNVTQEPSWASSHQRALLLLLGFEAGSLEAQKRTDVALGTYLDYVK